MSNLNEEQIRFLAEKIFNFMKNESATAPDAIGEERKGVFQTIGQAINAAGIAQKKLMDLTLKKREAIILSIRKTMLNNASLLAAEAVSETGLGRVEDKILKNQLVSEKTPGIEDLQPHAWSGDRGLSLFEQAPFGVIGAITPITNPTSTTICNAIGMIAAGNAVVFNAHPGAQKTSNLNIHLLNTAIEMAEGPSNLITTVAQPSIETAQQLMQHPAIRLLMITGGAGVVKTAMNSGKRAICAGPGNPPVLVDETADIDLAGREIVNGASFDNNIICVDEKEVIAVRTIVDQLIRAMTKSSAILLDVSLHSRLEKMIFEKMNGPGKPATINKSLIGKNADFLLAKIGVQADRKIRLIIVEVEKEHPLVWTEQMMPILPIVRVDHVDEGIDFARQAEGSNYHTAVMYSRNIDKLSRMAREINTTIFVKNGPAYAGLGFGGEGYTSFSIASPTGEGLTGPRTFSRERRCVLVDHFRIV